MLVFPIALASLWSAVTAELVVESARSGAGALVLGGRVLAVPPPDATVLILCGVSASAALAMAAAVAYARGRRLERRMAAELADRWRDLAEREVAEQARKDLLAWRIGELQTLVDGLLAERRGRHEPRPLFVVPDMPDERATSAEPTARSRR
jgi:hypothetical protein